MKDRGILSMTEAQYRAAEGVSKSDLDWICPPRTPAHYKAKQDGLIANEQTPAMRLGSMLHHVILEPGSVDWVVKPEGMNFATKDGKAWRDAQTKPIISQDEANMIGGMRDSVYRHPGAKRLLEAAQGKTEICLFADDDNGVLRKGRLDALPEGSNAIVDLKTTAVADAVGGMESSMAKFRYHVQAAYYLDLCRLLEIPREKFILICVEKEPPYAVAVYSIDDLAIEAGRLEYRRDLHLLRHCMAEDHWPGYPEEILSLGLPPWFKAQVEAVL